MIQSVLGDTLCSAPPRFPTVSIIGSAGRRSDSKRMTKDLFSKMVDKAKAVITDDFKLNLCDMHLVSGGAAWADHIAVVLYMHEEVGQLTLHLPAKWENSRYVEKEVTSKKSWKSPGQSTNELHAKFSHALGENTLEQIDMAFMSGANCRVHDGFQKRNTEVASSNYLVAFTWADGNEPKKPSGTIDTWEKCSGRKVHIPLQSLVSETCSKPSMQRKRVLCDDVECDGPKRKKLENGALQTETKH